MRSIGIIGGVGPETTAKFYLEIIQECQEKEKSTRPSIIISSVPLPYKLEREAILENKGLDKFANYLVTEARRLEKIGADFIVMPCNSLHLFIEDIRDSVTVPVLSIIDETVSFLKRRNFAKVGVVSTAITAKYQLYEEAFKEDSIEYSGINDKQQEELNNIVIRLVNSDKRGEDRDKLLDVINSFTNIDCVILACTDLQLLEPSLPGVKIFDTMEILANASVREILQRDD